MKTKKKTSKRIRIVLLIACLALLICYAVQYGITRHKIMNRIREVYGDGLSHVQISRSFELSQKGHPYYHVYAKNRTNDVSFEIFLEYDLENDYTCRYWGKWMRSTADEIVKKHFGDDAYLYGMRLTGDFLPVDPNEPVMDYEQYMSEHVDSLVYIVFHTSIDYNGNEEKFNEFYEDLVDSGLIFGKISVFAEEDGSLLYENNPDGSNEVVAITRYFD